MPLKTVKKDMSCPHHTSMEIARVVGWGERTMHRGRNTASEPAPDSQKKVRWRQSTGRGGRSELGACESLRGGRRKRIVDHGIGY